MMKKLLLINPASEQPGGLNVSKLTRFQPLGLGILATLTPGTWEVELIDENFEIFTYRHADLVALSAFTSTANRAYKIAKIYREKGVHTVLGGIHASVATDEALGYVDTVVVGEAENVWGQLIADFENNHIQKTYGPSFANMEERVLSKRELFSPNYIFASVQTTRGCPMDCEFCSASLFNGNTYRFRPVDQILDELEKIPQKYIFFTDDNLIGISKEHRERAISLFKGMIERKMNKKWLCQASINIAENEELLTYAHRAGCTLVLVGVESENVASLQTINKKMNLTRVDRYGEYFRTLHKHKIAVLGAFIFGMDTDSYIALENRRKYIMDCGIDVVQATALTPLPGTRIYQKFQAENRMLRNHFPEDWDLYTFLQVTFQPKLMTPELFHEELINNVRILYSYKNICKRTWRLLVESRSLYTAYWVWIFNMVYRRGMFKSYPTKQK